ncbi:hypothetical protein [Mesorhizobium sp. M0520]|uniref:hypothetical protein n=1 Tax=Mesorhizobium sp. M0520 TaxID=2956957 RepID=UPI003337DEAA
MRYLRNDDLPPPVRPVLGPAPHGVMWREADSSPVLSILQNPAHAGAYVYGRRRMEGAGFAMAFIARGRPRSPSPTGRFAFRLPIPVISAGRSSWRTRDDS